MDLDDPKVDSLVARIRDTFRVRADQDPVYVDIRGHLQRIAAPQHQVVFGRRGSGKSCLLIHYHRHAKNQFKNLSIYVQSDEIKTLPYPDLLIRLLLTAFEALGRGRRGVVSRFRRPSKPLQPHVEDLRSLLDVPLTSSVEEGTAWSDTNRVEASARTRGLGAAAGSATRDSGHHTARFREEKLDALQRHLQDFKSALDAMDSFI
jgi:hypothetical protein